MTYCPICKCEFSYDLAEETSLADHGKCIACHKVWQARGELAMRILEFKHIGPFDGCFHRWEYLAVPTTTTHCGDEILDTSDEFYPIVFTPKHLLPRQVVLLACAQEALKRGQMTPKSLELKTNLFKEFKWWEWDQNLFDEIPCGYFPAFWDFAEEMGLTFTWFCDKCDQLQVDEPVHMSSYRGNGGVGIEVWGWLCEDCAYSREEEECARWEDEQRDWLRRNEES